MMKLLFSLFISIGIIFITPSFAQSKNETQQNVSGTPTTLILLGIFQDAGSPQIGCDKKCCHDLFKNPNNDRMVISLGIYDSENNKRYLFEATPDFPKQVKALKNFGTSVNAELPDGIFLTHAHIGHYTGLIYLGKEAINALKIPVYTMPKMKRFLETNGPWSQLVSNENIVLNPIESEVPVTLSASIEVTPILVPHRDEFSETVGYRIKGPNKTALFIPDIDKWEMWNRDIIEEIKKVDYAFLDATFYSGKEINNRDISEIPHPFIVESLDKFKGLSKEEKNKVIFIHFNHTNPAANLNSYEAKSVISQGYKIGQTNDIFQL